MKNYRIGCNTLYPDIEERKSKGWTFSPEKIIEALNGISKMGYTDVEYSHIYHLTPYDAMKIGQHASQIGLNSWSCHAAGPGGFNTGDAVDASIAANLHCIDISSTIGAKVNVLHLTSYKHDDACRILEKICQHAAEKSLEIALENSGTLESMEFILKLIREVDVPNLGICVDTGHANLGDLGAPRAIRMAGFRLFTTHLQDNMGQRDDHMAPGMGIIDWEDVAKALKEIDYKRTLMLELTDAPPASRPYNQDAEMRAGIENALKFFV